MRLPTLLALSFLSLHVFAEPIENHTIEGLHSRNVQVYSLKPRHVYAISCTSSFDHLKAAQTEDVDKLSLQVNPGEVTDRHGRHGVTASYDFPAPIGTANFYAKPDVSGTIDFAIVNTTTETFYVSCNINLQR